MSKFILLLIFPALLGAQDTATIEIDAAHKAAYVIPRTIYGTFLEPIGNSIYGGLWAQLLENPSFEDNLWSADGVRRKLEREPELARSSRMGLPLPWEPLKYAQGWRFEPRWGDASNSFRSLLLMGLPEAEVGLRQQVYLPVHRVLRYTGSIFAKASSAGSLRVSFRKRNNADDVLSTRDISIQAGPWRKYEFALELKPGQLARLEAADFVVSLKGEERVLIDQVLLFPADNIDGMDPEMIAMSKELKTPVIRYGGNFTSGYHWPDGVGPVDKRVSMLNQSWGMPEYNQFGTDEFLKFCRHVGAVPQICLNLGSGTPEEAAAWVRYVNQHWNGGKGGLLWELGNELWGDFQIGYPTLKRVSARTKLFSDAVHKTDARAQLIATGQDSDRFREWNAAQLGLPSGTFQYLATHFVVGTATVKQANPTAEFVAESAFALPVGLERRLREMKKQIDANPAAGKNVKIAFTEWLFHGPIRSPRFDTMGGAICTAGFLNTLMRTADFVPISDMTGLIEFGGVWKKKSQVYGVPAYWAFRMYSNADATVPVEARTKGAHYNIDQGNNRIPQIHDVPYLDVVAALNQAGDKLTLFCVNRRQSQSTIAQIHIAGFNAATAARVQTLNAADIYVGNNEEQPEKVKPVESSITVSADEFKFTFQPASVTVLELKRKLR